MITSFNHFPLLFFIFIFYVAVNKGLIAFGCFYLTTIKHIVSVPGLYLRRHLIKKVSQERRGVKAVN